MPSTAKDTCIPGTRLEKKLAYLKHRQSKRTRILLQKLCDKSHNNLLTITCRDTGDDDDVDDKAPLIHNDCTYITVGYVLMYSMLSWAPGVSI